MSAFLRAARRGRLTAAEAREAIRDLLALPFQLSAVTPLAERAVTIAQQYNQRVYDCLYVALADEEGGARCGPEIVAFITRYTAITGVSSGLGIIRFSDRLHCRRRLPIRRRRGMPGLRACPSLP